MRTLLGFAFFVCCALVSAGCATGDGAEELGTGGAYGGGGSSGGSGHSGASGHGFGGAAGAGGWPGECTGSEEKPCYTGPVGTENVGACKSGKQPCAGGTWGACQGETLPADEKCNGVDDDCDGQVDEGNPEAGTACATGTPGVCAAGTSVCDSGKLSCNPNTPSSTEKCDGADNDCDGQTDEGCNCIDGASQNCYTGASGTQGVGPCKGGTQTCSGGQWGTCAGQVVPATEACNNGADDDCDGDVDENCGCAHDVCTSGAKLKSGCDSASGNCVAKVCAADSFCCSSTWDTMCVSEVRTVCKSLKCAESKGNCSHTPCTTGSSLANGCDSIKANCVSKVCAVDPYCCNNSWDNICVGKVPTYCSYSCQ